MNGPDDSLERALRERGFARIAGVDEVGRGPLAGPVVAAAVILSDANPIAGLNDSKKLSALRREKLCAEINVTAETSIAEASVEEIDDLNILRASHLAMERAVAALDPAPDYVLVDGNLLPRDLSLPAQAVVKGDARSISIAAASIVAKTWRDQLMVDLAQQHPGYGWETNMGYPSKSHRLALQNLGVTPHHRRSFKPVHNILYQEKFPTD
ncbi:MAG: ribonuclease HII [Arenibacterium sp.]